jgi:glucosamine--fructose-6-phosphate aminotransferase (isomerizing)
MHVSLAPRGCSIRVKKNSPKILNAPAGRGSKRAALTRRGAATLREILSQPETWKETARHLTHSAAFAQIHELFFPREPLLFVACGSSYYLSQMIATQWSKLLSVSCTAIPASEMLFAPAETLARARAQQVVLISRSGKTTEVLRVARLLAARSGMRTLGITCNEHSELADLCTVTFSLPWADEKSLVMTRSFTAILLLFARLAADFTQDAALSAALGRLPGKAAAWLAANADKIRAFGAGHRFGDFVFLGQQTHYWLAQEGALKMTEMSSSYAQAYHTLEFRHGPKSIASPDTLITFLLSDATVKEESQLVEEVKKLGAATMVIGNHVAQAARRASDLTVALEFDEPEFARLALAAIPAQLLGLAVGLRKGLNPDQPKNLTRAVVLDSGDGCSVAPRERSTA